MVEEEGDGGTAVASVHSERGGKQERGSAPRHRTKLLFTLN